ncbi:MAG TPA: replicative DNA helicase [bacterium]|nr:replicative DNA helicase [bacterium]
MSITRQLERIPPQNLEAEQGVLGSMLLDRDAIARAVEGLRPEDFYRDAHRVIFTAMLDLFERGEPVDLITVTNRLAGMGKLDDVGGATYLASLPNVVPTAANVDYYAGIVLEKSMLRALISAGTHIATLGYEGADDVAALVDQAEKLVFGIAARRNVQDFQAIKEILKESFEKIDRRYQEKGTVTGIATGFTDFDMLTSGLQPADMVVVAARPAVGKTTLSLNIAQHAALAGKVPVAIFSLETSKEQLVQRILCSEAQVDNTKLRTGFLADEDWRRLARAMGGLSEAPIFVDDSPTLSVIEMRAKARKLKAEHGLGLIVIDYIQMIQSYRRAENRTQELSDIARSIKSLAKELDIPIIAVSQLSRAVEALGQKRPMLSHLRECVTGDTLVLLSDGRRAPIRSLVGSTPSVLSMSPDGRIIPATADAVWSVGPREVLEVHLASGRSIRATHAHRLYSGKGWVRVKDLRVGDRIAIARRLPAPVAPQPWPDEQIVLLAHLIGDGCYLEGHSIGYTTSSEENSAIVASSAATRFGAHVHRVAGRRMWHQLRLSGNSNRWVPGRMKCWLQELNVFGQRSHEKRVPEAVFQLPNEQIAAFLRHLWATDGAIWTPPERSRVGLRVYYATNSKGLAYDVAALLLRLGIVARIYRIRQGRYKPNYHVVVSGSVNQQRFLDRVGTFGPRVAQGERLRIALATREANTNVDTLPRKVFDRVRTLMREQGITTRQMAALRGTAYGGAAHFKFAPSRDLIREYAEILGDDDLRSQSNDDLFWDRVTAIDTAGAEEAFDLTVPGTASWLADGIVTHNSGEIEQVSDLVLFLYREDYYDLEKAQKENKENICEVIIAKHRNGPIGTVELYFHKEYSRFNNLEKRR